MYKPASEEGKTHLTSVHLVHGGSVLLMWAMLWMKELFPFHKLEKKKKTPCTSKEPMKWLLNSCLV